jgi:phenylacetate-CoA ligase
LKQGEIAMSSASVFERLRQVHTVAYDRAPAIRDIFDRAGLLPANLKTAQDLSRLPVFKKEAMLDMQRQRPPFGGFLAAPESEIARIFVSPGPINEPQLRDEHGGLGFDAAFAAAGLGRGDRVLNTWSYHLVPAGLLLDEGLRAVGATVIPAGVGGSELQAKLVLELGVTCICASTAFFVTLAETIEGMGHKLPEAWQVKSALLGGEFGDWLGKRARLEAKYGIRTFAVYATADFGVIGFESGNRDGGYEIHPDRIVQICDPVSGVPLPLGEPGEIVVTTLTPGWPLIRFGTGDVAYATAMHDNGTVQRIGMLQGRVGQSVKAREIFIYPRQLEDLAIAVSGIDRAQAVVSRPSHREEITLRLALSPEANREAVLATAAERFNALSRLKADHVEIVDSAALAADAPLVVDRKDT